MSRNKHQNITKHKDIKSSEHQSIKLKRKGKVGKGEQKEKEETKDRFTEWVVDVMGGEVRQRFRTGVPLLCTI